MQSKVLSDSRFQKVPVMVTTRVLVGPRPLVLASIDIAEVSYSQLSMYHCIFSAKESMLCDFLRIKVYVFSLTNQQYNLYSTEPEKALRRVVATSRETIIAPQRAIMSRNKTPMLLSVRQPPG